MGGLAWLNWTNITHHYRQQIVKHSTSFDFKSLCTYLYRKSGLLFGKRHGIIKAHQFVRCFLIKRKKADLLKPYILPQRQVVCIESRRLVCLPFEGRFQERLPRHLLLRTFRPTSGLHATDTIPNGSSAFTCCQPSFFQSNYSKHIFSL